MDSQRRACRRSRDGWRAQLGCGITLFIHRNGWNSATPLDLQNNTRDEVLAGARAHWADVTDFYGADGRLKPSTWQPLVDGEHIYAARPYEMWMWAGRAEGVRETIDVDGREVVLETLDLSPRLFRLHGLLTPNEIAEIRRAADAQGWAPSVSFDPDTGREYSLAEGRRRAHTAWVGTEYGFKRPDLVTNEALERLQRRAADAARVHVGHAEPWQVVKYDVGDGQLHHIDGLKTAHGSTRSVTVLVYLTTVTEGGATNFPFAAGGNGDIDEPGSCARGRNIQPKAGDAVLFYNIEPPSLPNGHDSSNGGGGGGGGSSGGRTNPTGPPAAAARAAISDAEEVPWYSRGLHELHGPPRESLLLPDGCVADGRARVLTQGHRTPVHLLLVHPHTQAVLTVDALHVSVYDLLPAGVSLAACPRVSARLPPDETPSCAAIAQAGDRWAIGLSGGAILLLEEAPSRPHGAIFTRLERPPVASGPPPGPRPLPTLLTHPLDPPTALLASSTNPEFFHPTAPSHPLELDDATCLDERSGELPAGSSEFRQWSSSVPASSSGVSSVASSSASVGAPTTSTAGATASRSTAARKPVRAPDRSVVTIAFNAEGTMLAYACMDHVVGCHTLPLTHAQRTRRHLQRVARALAPDPARTSRLTGRLANGEPPLPNMGGVVPDGAVDDARDDVICSAAVYMPPPCPTSGWSTEPTPTVALLWSVSSAHVFVLSRARTARPVAVHANGSLRPVHASAVGAAEWPADLDAAMTRALAACDSGALLAARWHPLPPTRAPSKRASLAPPAGMASEPRYGQPPIRPKSIRPRHLPELLSHATVSGGLAVIGGRLGELSVHSGLSWPLRSHEALDTAGDDVPKASYNPWASAYNPKYDMGSYSPYATAAHLLRAARSQPGSRTPSPSAGCARDRSPARDHWTPR